METVGRISCRALAKEIGVSHDTAARIIYCRKNATEEQKVKLRTGDISINKVYTGLKDKTKEASNCQSQM